MHMYLRQNRPEQTQNTNRTADEETIKDIIREEYAA